jgi:hypothetical protein
MTSARAGFSARGQKIKDSERVATRHHGLAAHGDFVTFICSII